MTEEGYREVRFRHSPSFAEVLRQMRCTLLVSTYQAGKLIALGLADDRLHLSFHEFDQVMGVAASPDRVAVGARGQVWSLAANQRLAQGLEPAGRYDRCYLARSATVTGEVQGHELAWGRDAAGLPELWVVNTAFSCLATLHPEYSFVPRWQPPFVTALAAEDRCHLNGVGMRDGRPAAVTVMGRTDTAGGWRADKNAGGCVLDVGSGQPITTGLSMPHSPRLYGGHLLVLNSGHGTLESVDPASGARTVVETLPGFTRGLAGHGNLAFVGLSRIRETAVFGGVPIAARHEDLKCGIGVVDLVSGRTVATLEFESGVEEIFDVQVLPETRCVALTGGRLGTEGEIWVVPQPGSMSHDRLSVLRRAAAAQPDSATAANHLGNALQDAGDQVGALEAYGRAIIADPGFGPARQNLGYLLINRGRTGEGIEQLEHAQRVDPRPVNRAMLATALPVVYESAAAVDAARERLEREVAALVADGVQVDTTDAQVPTNFFAAYQGRNDRALHENLARVYRGVDAVGARTPGSRIRVGFLSAYFRDHTIGRLNLGRVQHLDRERFEVTVIAASAAEDPMARAFAAAADRFLRVPRGVAAARHAIAELGLDVLVFTDVGMDALTYSLAFSRMAPVQCATWGHPVTTGSPAMDHFISSELLETPDADAHYTERLARLPSLGTYYHRPTVPDVTGLRDGLPPGNLYACPQTLFKFHPDFDAVLAGVLRADPEGRLLLIQGRVPTWTESLRDRFARVMPDVVDRIHWLPALPRERFLALLATVDVLLDTAPFGGGNTTYEALAVNAPVVTLDGEFLRGRITQALYARMGYTDLVADSVERYVATAVQLGTDPAHRAAVSTRLADAAGVLYENAGEIRDLEAFLETVSPA